MTEFLKNLDDLKVLEAQESLAFVPTMGALHAGHLSLVDIAQKHAKKVIVSIFVNPTQFGANEDLAKYPRPLEEDLKKLAFKKVDYVFLPDTDLIYPHGLKISHYANKELNDILCGAKRPGHFDGVCTVLHKFFTLIKPQYAVFGQKDYQQLMVVKDLIKTQELDIEIIEAPIIREADGLAMSSRNRYLYDDERQKAALLNKALDAVIAKEQSIDEAKAHLNSNGLEVEYLEEHWGRLFVAAKLGNTRLIDNKAL